MTDTTAPTFDPIAYKTTTREQWQEALPSTAECIRFERESFGALHQMLGALEQAACEEAWEEIEEELGRFVGPDGFEGPCELVVAAATK